MQKASCLHQKRFLQGTCSCGASGTVSLTEAFHSTPCCDGDTGPRTVGSETSGHLASANSLQISTSEDPSPQFPTWRKLLKTSRKWTNWVAFRRALQMNI